MKKKNTSQKTDVATFKKKIITFLQTNNKKTIPISELETKCRSKKQGHENFMNAFDELRTDGIITVRKGMKVGLCSRLNMYPATVTKLSRTFGFAKTDDGIEYFIPGKCMLGAMPDDRVLISDIPSRSGEPEGEVIDIIKFGSSVMTGKVEFIDGKYYLVPDTASKNHLTIVKEDSVKFNNGEKVLAEIVFRGRRHSEHKVKITSVFGHSEQASSCAKSILMIHGAPDEFPEEVLKEARKIAEG